MIALMFAMIVAGLVQSARADNHIGEIVHIDYWCPEKDDAPKWTPKRTISSVWFGIDIDLSGKARGLIRFSVSNQSGHPTGHRRW